METLALLLAWKWALPRNVYLLRGNHETNTITRIYGFYAELRAKYGAESKVTQHHCMLPSMKVPHFASAAWCCACTSVQGATATIMHTCCLGVVMPVYPSSCRLSGR